MYKKILFVVMIFFLGFISVMNVNSQENITIDKCITLTQNMKIGDKDGLYSKWEQGKITEVKTLQEYMNQLGFNAGPVDGVIGKQTEGAIKRMQKVFNTYQDGMVGPKTRALMSSYCKNNSSNGGESENQKDQKDQGGQDNKTTKTESTESKDSKSKKEVVDTNIFDNKCPLEQTLTQNMKVGDKDGFYSKWEQGKITEVKILQTHMNRLGFSAGPIDGYFGKQTEEAVKRMQKFLGTKQDGLVGPETRKKINNSCSSKKTSGKDDKSQDNRNKETEKKESEKKEESNENTSKQAPTIHLKGEENLTIRRGQRYEEAGAEAADANGNDLSDKIEISGEVDWNNEGTYHLTYKVKDTFGNVTSKTRKVVVKRKRRHHHSSNNNTNNTDTVKPVITLTGENPQTITVGNVYVELGATASDNVDGDISANITIDTSAVNTAVAGNYTVTYNVTDAAGNVADEVVRDVKVEPSISDALFAEKARFKKVNGHGEYVPPIIRGFTHYNRDYYDYCKANNLPVQETPWGFQEINLANGVVEHHVHNADQLYQLLKPNGKEKLGVRSWGDDKVHKIILDTGVYDFTDKKLDTTNYGYYYFYLPSRTIIQGAGKDKTVIIPPKTYKPDADGNKLFGTKFSTSYGLKYKKLNFFYAEGSSVYDIAIRDLYFKTTKLRENPKAEWDKYEVEDNRWLLWAGRAGGGTGMQNLLFENIKTDSMFTPSKTRHDGDFHDLFITIRGVEKTVGSTIDKMKALITRYGSIKKFNNGDPGMLQWQVQFGVNPYWLGKEGDSYHKNNDEKRYIIMSEQLALAEAQSVVIHNCKLGETVSAAVDFYGNYLEIVGTEFRDVQADHSIKNPSGNHIYIHDSSYYLDKNYSRQFLINGFWNPAFFRLQTGDPNLLQNMHFKNLTLKQKERFHIYQKSADMVDYKFSNVAHNRFGGFPAFSVYKECITEKCAEKDRWHRKLDNKSGDLIWENIDFQGIIPKEYGFSNVQVEDGYQAIVYGKKEGEEIRSAYQKDTINNSDFDPDNPTDQLSYYDNRLTGDNKIVEERNGSSIEDVTGVYTWGQWDDGYIDFARNNSTRHSYYEYDDQKHRYTKYDPDLNGQYKLKSKSILAPYYIPKNTSATDIIKALYNGDYIKE